MAGSFSLRISDSRRYLEILAVILTATGKFIFMDLLNLRLPFVAAAILGWATYILVRQRAVPDMQYIWGFRFDNFRRTLSILVPFAFIAIVSCVLIGYWRETINLTWHVLPVMLLYPLWGVIQQFLVVALVAGNLHDMQRFRFKKPFIIVFTALLFGLIHYPYYWLMVGTFVLALLYGYVYLKERNLFVLGLFHGWLGALFFYTVVGRDPFLEVFGPWLPK